MAAIYFNVQQFIPKLILLESQTLRYSILGGSTHDQRIIAIKGCIIMCMISCPMSFFQDCGAVQVFFFCGEKNEIRTLNIVALK
jgi:hypothetical protein